MSYEKSINIAIAICTIFKFSEQPKQPKQPKQPEQPEQPEQPRQVIMKM